MPKRLITVFLSMILLITVLAGCAGKQDDGTASNVPTAEGSTFYGTVLESGDSSLLVEPEIGSSARSSSDKISVSVNGTLLKGFSKGSELNAGEKVKITFEGSIAESYPAQILHCKEISLIKAKYTLDDFWDVFQQYTEGKTQGNLSAEDKKENYVDFTPGAVFEETGGQIFKDSQWCSSYFLYEDKLYSLGEWFGGLGVVDVKTCDFDGNGKKDLLFTYSWGSGIHRALIGHLDLTTMEQSVVYNSQGEDDEVYQASSDLVLEKKSDDSFNVYIAEFINQNNNVDFTKMHFNKGKHCGGIICENAKAIWKAE